jgi:hypothetical protein
MGGYVSIAREASTEFSTGHGTVGVTKAALASASAPLSKYVIIKADLTNTNNVFVGGPTVTTTTGFLLDAGEATPPIHIDDLSKVYVVGDAASQGFSWLAV